MARLPGKLPGLYMIQTDDKGERRFFHWRDSAAARSLMDLPQTPEILNSLAGYDVIYLSAITLSLYGGGGPGAAVCGAQGARVKLGRALLSIPISARVAGPISTSRAPFSRRPLLWPISCWLPPRICLPLYPGVTNEALLARIPGAEVVLKLSEPASIVRLEGVPYPIKAKPVEAPVVDTTAAGDSFAAAYVAARLVGADPIEAARAGHRLAGVVVCHPGAIIPRAEMPPGLIPNHVNSRKASP